MKYRRRTRLAPSLAAGWLVAVVGCAAAPRDDAPVLCGGAPGPCGELRVVAHQDDDLLFMNPDLAAGLEQGNRLATVYVTAGTSTDPARLTARELGVLNAYTFLVAPADAATAPGDAWLDHWRLHDGAPIAIEVAGGTRRAIQLDYVAPLPPGGALSLVFLRVVEHGGAASLQAVARGAVPEVPTVGCTSGCVLGAALEPQRYTRDQLIDALAALIARFDDPRGLAVSTLDATGLFHREPGYGLGWVDHADHLATAELAVSAVMRAHRAPRAAPLTLAQYRGYDTGRAPANLGVEVRAKRRAFYRYYVLGEPLTGVADDGTPIEYTNRDPDDPQFWLVNYQVWTERRYAIPSLPPAGGQLAAGAPARCLRAIASAIDGALGLGPCDGAPAWRLDDRDALHPAGDPATCVVLDAAGDAARAAPCVAATAAERQSFVLTATGQLRARDAACLTADDAGVRAARCELQVDGAGDPLGRAVDAQRWAWR